MSKSTLIFMLDEETQKAIPVYAVSSSAQAAARVLSLAAKIAPKLLRINPDAGDYRANSANCQCVREYTRAYIDAKGEA